LLNYFCSVVTSEDLFSLPSFGIPRTISHIDAINTSLASVYHKLFNIIILKLPDSNGWPLFVLKETADFVIPPQ